MRNKRRVMKARIASIKVVVHPAQADRSQGKLNNSNQAMLLVGRDVAFCFVAMTWATFG